MIRGQRQRKAELRGRKTMAPPRMERPRPMRYEEGKFLKKDIMMKEENVYLGKDGQENNYLYSFILSICV